MDDELYVVSDILRDIGYKKIANDLMKTRDFTLIQPYVNLILQKLAQKPRPDIEERLWASGLMYA